MASASLTRTRCSMLGGMTTDMTGITLFEAILRLGQAIGAWATRSIPVCGPGAFTVLKALAFGNRAENKDAYDLFYVWSGVGVPEVAESLAPLRPSTHIDDALSVIERDFCNHDGLGPIATAQFITLGLDDNVQAEVVGHAQELLRSLGRL